LLGPLAALGYCQPDGTFITSLDDLRQRLAEMAASGEAVVVDGLATRVQRLRGWANPKVLYDAKRHSHTAQGLAIDGAHRNWLWRTFRDGRRRSAGDGHGLLMDMAGFIVMEDGRAYAASNRATDAVIRAIAAQVDDREFRAWLLQQQSQFVGMGMTSVDLREVTPRHRQGFYRAARRAYERAASEGFEGRTGDVEGFGGWLERFGDLVVMIDRSLAGESPEVFPPTGWRRGPGWLGSDTSQGPDAAE
jgi:hypothetical protein